MASRTDSHDTKRRWIISEREWWLNLAELLDALRVFPRLFVALYFVLCYHLVTWAMGLKDLSAQQAALVGAVTGMMPILLNFYMASGRKWQKED